MRQQSERRLRRAAEELAQAELQQKQVEQDFFAMTCHEIRNPLNGLVGCLRLVSPLLSQLSDGVDLAAAATITELREAILDATLCSDQALQVTSCASNGQWPPLSCIDQP